MNALSDHFLLKFDDFAVFILTIGRQNYLCKPPPVGACEIDGLPGTSGQRLLVTESGPESQVE